MVNNLVIKVDTFKSGPFAFSRNYSLYELVEPLIRAGELYKAIVDLPILPNRASKLEEDLIRRSIFGTAAIEGNPLTEEQVEEVLDLPPEGASQIVARAEKEIFNLKVVYRAVDELDPVDDNISEGLIRTIHKHITKGIEYPRNVPGEYRSHAVKVGDKDHGGVYTPPKILDDIKNLMKEFAKWINSAEVKELDQIILAGLAHYHLALIHPFGNGNGRAARLLEALIMRSAGIRYAPLMLSNFYYRNIDEYFWAFSKSRKNKNKDVTPFLEFVLRGFCESLEEIRERIIIDIRLLTMREHNVILRNERRITQRQHDFLATLLDYQKPFTFGDLYAKPMFRVFYESVSERTARRDLKKLHSMNILTKEGDRYSLNIKALG